MLGRRGAGDALTVVMDAQRRAGVEVICDGELGRWDLERRAPGGMVERFVRPLEGVSAELTRGQLEAYRSRTRWPSGAHRPAWWSGRSATGA